MISRPSLQHWISLALHYLGAQTIIRLASTASALALVHMLPVDQYGVYTLLLANLTFLVGLSDFGASASLAFFWRRTTPALRPFQAYIEGVQRLRKQLFVCSALASVFYLLALSRTKGFDTVGLAYGSAMMLVATWLYVRIGTGLVLLRIRGEFNQSYLVEASSEITKLLVTCLLLLLGSQVGWLALSGMLAGAIVADSVLTRLGKYDLLRSDGLSTHSLDRAYRAVRDHVLPTVPWTLFFVIQSPLIAWLAATFGSVHNLAEVGALGRLASIVGLVSGFTVSILVPRLGHIKDERQYFRHYLAWWVLLIFLGLAILLMVIIWPQIALLIIGDQYSGLANELVLAVLTSIVMTFEFYAGAINRARGWMGSQMQRVAVIAIGQALFVPWLDFSRTDHLLAFGFATACLMTAVQVTFNIRGLSQVLSGQSDITRP